MCWRLTDGALFRRGRGLPVVDCRRLPDLAESGRTARRPTAGAQAGDQSGSGAGAIPEAPEADPKSKEEKRFDRADKDDDGKIVLAELVEPRRKPFAKLDVNGDGRLSFEEWAVKTIDKFKGADADRNAALTRAEYATTAPKPKAKKPACDC